MDKVIIVVAIICAIWWLSVKFGPLRKCPRCGGDGTVPAMLGGRRQCSGCGGNGIIKRRGAS